MTVTIKRLVYDLATKTTTSVVKELEYIESPKPTQEGFVYDEWLEETDTQLIQHWVAIPEDATEEDYLEALAELGADTDEEE